jgi:hypothetical protein
LVSLEHLYMFEHLPEQPLHAPPHQLWQSPFVFAKADESWERLQARVRRAGELWLINQDMRAHNELVIAHSERPWFMAFQRAARPDEGHIFIGPFERRVLRPEVGLPLWELPLRYRETERATSRELWRQIARSDSSDR